MMLEAGTGNLGSIWTEPPDGPGPPVLPAVARFTRVAYDRPGTYTYPDTFSRSDPVAMPRTTLDIVRDLNALLRAAGAPRPRAGRPLLRRHGRAPLRDYPSQGGRRAGLGRRSERGLRRRLKAAVAPGRVRGQRPRPTAPPGLNYPEVEILDLEPSAAQMRQAQADTPLRPMPFVVLSHSRTIPNPFGYRPNSRSRRWRPRFRTHRTCWRASCRAPST